MDARTRHERQIKLLGGALSRQFDTALDRLIRKHGMAFFTDEQIAELRAEMIGDDWFRHRLNRENRKRRAA
jgi:hypothetical protein